MQIDEIEAMALIQHYAERLVRPCVGLSLDRMSARLRELAEYVMAKGSSDASFFPFPPNTKNPQQHPDGALRME